jgi:hemerythrin
MVPGGPMTKFVWTEQLNVGIDVIDQQHRRIGEYINQLDDALSFGHSREEIGWLINEVTDYTISHFGFEESLQNEANYPFAKPHKKVHDLFAARVADYREKFEKGEDVAAGLNSLLVTWLFNHIKRDDADYVESVKAYLEKHKDFGEKKKGLFARLFG